MLGPPPTDRDGTQIGDKADHLAGRDLFVLFKQMQTGKDVQKRSALLHMLFPQFIPGWRLKRLHVFRKAETFRPCVAMMQAAFQSGFA